MRLNAVTHRHDVIVPGADDERGAAYAMQLGAQPGETRVEAMHRGEWSPAIDVALIPADRTTPAKILEAGGNVSDETMDARDDTAHERMQAGGWAKCRHPGDARLVRGGSQHERTAEGVANQHNVDMALQLRASRRPHGAVPVIPAGGGEVAYTGAVAGQPEGPRGEAFRTQHLLQLAHFARIAIEAVNQQARRLRRMRCTAGPGGGSFATSLYGLLYVLGRAESAEKTPDSSYTAPTEFRHGSDSP